MYNEFFTTSEFAKLCGVTKHTLFHYDQVGILKPDHVGDNGYRYYQASQFYTFDIISVLQETGMSLREIQEYMENRGQEAYLRLLGERRAVLNNKVRQLERMGRLLDRAASMVDLAGQRPAGVPWIEEREESYVLEAPLPPDSTEVQRVRAIREHFAVCRQEGLEEDLSIGAVAAREDVLRGDYEGIRAFFTCVPERAVSSRLVVRPRGRYGEILHHGSYWDMERSFRTLLAFIEDSGLAAAGDFYEYDLLNDMATADHEDYVLCISVQVR